jgi:hypothetical protein
MLVERDPYRHTHQQPGQAIRAAAGMAGTTPIAIKAPNPAKRPDAAPIPATMAISPIIPRCSLAGLNGGFFGQFGTPDCFFTIPLYLAY